jgi:hypothetical protein
MTQDTDISPASDPATKRLSANFAFERQVRSAQACFARSDLEVAAIGAAYAAHVANGMYCGIKLAADSNILWHRHSRCDSHSFAHVT